ncbi:MAG: hypothetical protein M1816_005805 [Peltula sp. TS41687]|nr:MAG: hypothetical protein M1816_005805 [Peltula sp. TS41687]
MDGGKSLAYVLPVILDLPTVTVVPLVALAANVDSRPRALGISPVEWASGVRDQAPLVRMTIDAAATPDLRTFLSPSIGAYRSTWEETGDPVTNASPNQTTRDGSSDASGNPELADTPTAPNELNRKALYL